MPQTLETVLSDVSRLPRKSVIHVPQGVVSVDVATEVLLVPGNERAPAGWRYLLEVWIALEVLEVWSAWREGREPTPAEAVEAVVHYAEHDAYLDVDGQATGNA